MSLVAMQLLNLHITLNELDDANNQVNDALIERVVPFKSLHLPVNLVI